MGKKDFKDLRFRDNFMFGKVMEDSNLCRDVLECLLQRPVGEIRVVETEKEIRITDEGKPIRLDVYNEDSDNSVYDTEMQNLNNKSVKWHQLPKRSRFYQGCIDTDFLGKGNHYRKLPESSVLFICTFDPLLKGMSQYTFRERCDEDPDILLGDGTLKVFYNCTYKGNDIPEELRKFYDFIMTDRAESELTMKIDKAVTEGRKNVFWMGQYLREKVAIEDAIEEEREAKEEALKRAEKESERAEKERKAKEEAIRRSQELEEEIRRMKEEIEKLKASGSE